MNRFISASLTALLVASALTACADQGSTPAEELARETGRMALTVDILDDTDVAGMQYTITGVDCETGEPLEPPYVVETTKDLEDLLLPGANQDLAQQPFDAGSGHLFADSFFWLPEGCYDVVAQPVNAAGEPSQDCAAASQDGVPVFDGQTTEILLINQCENDAYGGLDVIAALNHAPQISDIVYEPSKFTCEDQTKICVTVTDPDSDPLTAEWRPLSEDVFVAFIDATSNDDGSVTHCATLEVPGPGDYQIGFTVYDMGYGADGAPVRIEDLLAQQGQDLLSRDAAVLPIHAMSDEACVGTCECPDGFALNPAGDLCERVTTTAATFNGQLLTVCEGSKNANFGALGARFPGGSALQSDFFGDGYTLTNGSRLLTIGIWACGPNGGSTTQPEDEWIGFSRCLDIEEGGAYVVGIAADNFVRAKLNGQPLLQIDASNATEALHPYKRWHMIPVTLTTGSNIVEFEAMNVGGPAAFGAEIYGPFDPADLVDDASMMALDYEASIVWNTGEELGGTFATGTNSGWSCEGGAALNQCGDEPTCTLLEQEVCE